MTEEDERKFRVGTSEIIIPVPDARAALGRLKQRGHKTAILSNGSPAILTGAVDGAGIGSNLDAVLSVDVIRMYKPRPEVYALVISHFKCVPKDLGGLEIDDELKFCRMFDR